MSKKEYQYIYGPVPSWRLGSSLGIDPISVQGKVCTFDCIYCQLGRTQVLSDERREFVSVESLIREIEALPPADIDYITFSGAGEPTLAKNLNSMIRAVRQIRNEKIAVITNSSLLNDADVCEALGLADLVLAKLDAFNLESFWAINRPMRSIRFNSVMDSLRELSGSSRVRLALQMMFVEQNKKDALWLAHMAEEIHPQEIQMNTPLRPCGVQPLSEEDLEAIESRFKEICDKNIEIHNVYKSKKKKVVPVSTAATIRRRGKS